MNNIQVNDTIKVTSGILKGKTGVVKYLVDYEGWQPEDIACEIEDGFIYFFTRDNIEKVTP
jgi:ribosomal protein L24